MVVGDHRISDWLAQFEGAISFPLNWNSGAQAELQATISVTSPTCYATDWLPPGSSRLDYAVAAQIQTSDDSWTGDHAGYATLSGWEGSRPRIGLGGSRIVALDALASLGVPAAQQAVEAEVESAGPVTNVELQWSLSKDLTDETTAARVRLHALRDRDACWELDPAEQDFCLSMVRVEILEASSDDPSSNGSDLPVTDVDPASG